MLYGTLFMFAGAYTLSRNGHVRGDFLYRNWEPRTQAMMDLVLYIMFFFPGILALCFAGTLEADRAWLALGAQQFAGDRAAGALQDHHPDRRRPDAAAGHRRNHPLHPVHPDRRVAAPPARRRGDGEEDPRRSGAAAAKGAGR